MPTRAYADLTGCASNMLVGIFTRETAPQLKDFVRAAYPIISIAPQDFEMGIEIRDENEKPVLYISLRKDNYRDVLPMLEKLAEGDVFENINKMDTLANKKIGEWTSFLKDIQIRTVKKEIHADASDLEPLKE